MANQVDAQSSGRMVSVTPSDTDRIAPCIGISVNVDGNINVLPVGNTAPVVMAVTAGVMYPIRAKAVYTTSTTATGIIAHYQE